MEKSNSNGNSSPIENRGGGSSGYELFSPVSATGGARNGVDSSNGATVKFSYPTVASTDSPNRPLAPAVTASTAGVSATNQKDSATSKTNGSSPKAYPTLMNPTTPYSNVEQQKLNKRTAGKSIAKRGDGRNAATKQDPPPPPPYGAPPMMYPPYGWFGMPPPMMAWPTDYYSAALGGGGAESRRKSHPPRSGETSQKASKKKTKKKDQGPNTAKAATSSSSKNNTSQTMPQSGAYNTKSTVRSKTGKSLSAQGATQPSQWNSSRSAAPRAKHPQAPAGRNAAYYGSSSASNIASNAHPTGNIYQQRKGRKKNDGSTSSEKSKASVERIKSSLTADASCIVQIYGRRVNLDAHAHDASLYALLRSWAQDDPYRHVPVPGSNLEDYHMVESPPLKRKSLLSKKGKDQAPKRDDKKRKRETLDVISSIRDQAAVTDVQDLRHSLVLRGKRARRKAAQLHKARIAKGLKSLESRGIRLSSM